MEIAVRGRRWRHVVAFYKRFEDALNLKAVSWSDISSIMPKFASV